MSEAEAALRAEVCRIGRSLFGRGLVHATAGNISVRLPEQAGFLITPTDACLGFLEPDRLARADADGNAVDTRADAPRPSKTLALHRAIYAAQSAAHCVLHTHATHLVALTLKKEGIWREAAILPPITPYFVMKVGRVPLIAYHRPGDPAVATLVTAEIERSQAAPIRAVMLDRLGPVVWAESPAAAMAVLEELEETARLWLMTEPRPAPLGDEQIDELRRHFGARW